MDAAIPHGFDRVSNLEQLPSGGVRVGKGALLDEFHEVFAAASKD